MRREKINQSEFEAVRRIRKGGLSVEIIASEIGISPFTLYRWLDGTRTPGYLVTNKIRQFLRKHIIKAAAQKAKTEIAELVARISEEGT